MVLALALESQVTEIELLAVVCVAASITAMALFLIWEGWR
jgi:hypothetical protein